MTIRLPTALALVAIVAAGTLLRSQHMTDITSRSPDEQTYTAYAARLADEGFGVYRELMAAYDRSPAQWIYPSPTRFGNVLLAAGVMRVTGVRDGRAGAATSWMFSILSVALVAWTGVRFFPPLAALFGAALMACSFGELGMARRAWQDSVFGFCCLLMVYLACEIGEHPERRPLYVALSATGAFALVTKESSVLAYGLILLWLVGAALWDSAPGRVVWVAAAGAGSLGTALLVWIALAGDARIALASVDHSTRSGAGAWAKLYCSGPWYQFPYLLWITGPLTAAAALAGAGMVLWLRPGRAPALIAFFTMGFVAFASFFPNLQYLRIISPAAGSYSLLAGLGLWSLLSAIGEAAGRRAQQTAAVAAVIAVVAAGVNDYQSFKKVVVHSGMEELSVYGIRSLMHK